MSKYASLLFSPEKYHEIGPFRFPVFNDLVPGEARAMEEIGRKQSRATFKSIQLAKKIGKAKGISTKQAIELLSGASENGDDDLLYDYAEELDEMTRDGLGAVEQKVAFVTVFMQYRAEVKMPDNNAWTKTKDWQLEDTDEMPMELMEQIIQLIEWERDGWPEGKLNAAPSSTRNKS